MSNVLRAAYHVSSTETTCFGYRVRPAAEAVAPVADAATLANRNQHPNELRLAEAFRRYGHLEAHLNPLTASNPETCVCGRMPD